MAPWASDDSPLFREDFGDRPRWTPAPLESPDSQDTDDVTEMVSDIGDGDTSQISLQNTINDSSISGQRRKPPPPLSTVGQYKAAGHIDDKLSFSLLVLLVSSVICISIGVLMGFILGYILGGS